LKFFYTQTPWVWRCCQTQGPWGWQACQTSSSWVHTQVFLGLATTRDPRRMGLTACLAQGLWVQTQVSWVWQACQTYRDWVGQVCQTHVF